MAATVMTVEFGTYQLAYGSRERNLIQVLRVTNAESWTLIESAFEFLLF